MITKVKQLIADSIQTVGEEKTIELYPEIKEFVEKNNLIEDGIKIVEKSTNKRFDGAYIERSDKETEEFLGEENTSFLNQPISYFKTHKNEFMYMEDPSFDLVSVDAVSFEVDDVFGTYNVMLGLKLQKKYGEAIKSFFASEMKAEDTRVDLMFDANEGLWNVNFALNNVEAFNEEMTIQTAYDLIYRFLFKLVVSVL
ncbi:branched-chain amino acid aminotransferase [Mesobacillus maritimus]|uniref:Branched-chain amino acid aminotransferase n=1 Tax=Mesobacillus maritimus TaxID=1643336 RepID=A0ABS7K120_9BACI|nr:branched-chain amino acid aminotransferase [Mesobacillus maritimus]MBY0095921.1 branched-chain amino acid aminotransferase [Mesobacillus maritimus]